MSVSSEAHLISALLDEVAAIIIPLPSRLDQMPRGERVHAMVAVARRRARLVAFLIAALGSWQPSDA